MGRRQQSSNSTRTPHDREDSNLTIATIPCGRGSFFPVQLPDPSKMSEIDIYAPCFLCSLNRRAFINIANFTSSTLLSLQNKSS